jgi:hypothetical protein
MDVTTARFALIAMYLEPEGGGGVQRYMLHSDVSLSPVYPFRQSYVACVWNVTGLCMISLFAYRYSPAHCTLSRSPVSCALRHFGGAQLNSGILIVF